LSYFSTSNFSHLVKLHLASDLTREHVQNIIHDEIQISGAEEFFNCLSIKTFRAISSLLGVHEAEKMEKFDLMDRAMASLFSFEEKNHEDPLSSSKKDESQKIDHPIPNPIVNEHKRKADIHENLHLSKKQKL
jgi:hypothetical protein